MLRTFLVILATLLLPMHAIGKEKPRMVELTTPLSILEVLPELEGVEYRKRSWRRELSIPALGSKKAYINFFEFNFVRQKGGQFAATLISPKPPKNLEVVVVTQRNPDEANIANEAVNALLPYWLIEQGIDMFEVYRKPMGGYTFVWEGKTWSFDQLTELLSWVVPGQTLPGGYMSKDAVTRVCNDTPHVSVMGHDAYKLVHHMMQKHGCKLTLIHDEAGKALQAFMNTAPRY